MNGLNAGSRAALTKAPVAVLVNEGTSGPAELVAGAIRDNKRGQVVGWTTFGILLFIVTPLFTPALLVLGTVAPVVWHLFSTGMPPIKPSRLTIILAMAAGYLALNSSWSLSPSDAHSAVYMLIVSVVTLHFISGGLRGCDADALRAMAIGLLRVPSRSGTPGRSVTAFTVSPPARGRRG